MKSHKQTPQQKPTPIWQSTRVPQVPQVHSWAVEPEYRIVNVYWTLLGAQKPQKAKTCMPSNSLALLEALGQESVQGGLAVAVRCSAGAER